MEDLEKSLHKSDALRKSSVFLREIWNQTDEQPISAARYTSHLFAICFSINFVNEGPS